MRKLAIVAMPLLTLALVIGAVGCGGGELMSHEAQEISDFLNDKHVNAVLWEEWNIYDEWAYGRSLYENSPRLAEDLGKHLYQESILADRARQNYQDLLGINQPQLLQAFCDDIIVWAKQFDEFLDSSPHSPLSNWLLQRAYRKHAEAWLELKNICREHGIEMEWPLPRQLPASVGSELSIPRAGGGGESWEIPRAR